MVVRTFARSALALVVAVLALVIGARAAQAAYVPPALQGAVTDTSGTLAPGERTALEARLAAYRKRTTNEVVVFVLPSLAGESVEDVAYGAFNAWHVGKKGKDNGVLLVLAIADRKMRIETGKGIGGQLTDLESGRILRERIGPFLKQQRYADGIGAGLDAIEAALDGRPAPPMPDFTPKASSSAAPSASVAPQRDVPIPTRLFDRAGILPERELAEENGRVVLGDHRHTWRNLAVVVVRPGEELDTDVVDWTRAQTGGKPTVVMIDPKSRNVDVRIGYEWWPDRTREALDRMRQRSRAAAMVDLALLRDLGAIGVEVMERAHDDPSAEQPEGVPLVAILWAAVIATFLVFAVVLGWRRRRLGTDAFDDGGGGGGSSSSDASSSSSSSFTSSSFDASSSSSSSSSSDTYSGGGGSSGGGGASDGW